MHPQAVVGRVGCVVNARRWATSSRGWVRGCALAIGLLAAMSVPAVAAAATLQLPRDATAVLSGASGDDNGESVAGAGDFNSDGHQDVIRGASGADPGSRSGAGSATVTFGPIRSLPSATFQTEMFGVAAGDNAGQSVAGAGDFNGDGIDDVIVGAPNASPGGVSAAGSSYVVFGAATPLDLACVCIELKEILTPLGRGFRIDGARRGRQQRDLGGGCRRRQRRRARRRDHRRPRRESRRCHGRGLVVRGVRVGVAGGERGARDADARSGVPDRRCGRRRRQRALGGGCRRRRRRRLRRRHRRRPPGGCAGRRHGGPWRGVCGTRVRVPGERRARVAGAPRRVPHRRRRRLRHPRRLGRGCGRCQRRRARRRDRRRHLRGRFRYRGVVCRVRLGVAGERGCRDADARAGVPHRRRRRGRRHRLLGGGRARRQRRRA